MRTSWSVRVVALLSAVGGVGALIARGPGSDVPFALAMLVWGLGWVTVAALLAAERRARTVTLLALAGGMTLVCAAAIGVHPGLPTMAHRVAALALVSVLPVLWAVYPDTLPSPLRWTFLPVVVGFGIAVILWPTPEPVTDAASLGVPVAVVAAVWWRLERCPPEDREPLLWNALALGVCAVSAIPLLFVDSGWPYFVVVLILLLVTCAGVVVGLHPPAGVDVRLLILRTAVYIVTIVAALALFDGLAAATAVWGGGTPSLSALGVLSVVVAIAFLPIKRALTTALDRLLFGDRLDTLSVARRFGDELTAGDEPAAALYALREALWLPYAALVDSTGALVEAGTMSGVAHRIPLRIGASDVGTLVIGLRPGERRLSSSDQDALRVVAPALAQAVHAQVLAGELRRSRQAVVSAIEDERRRLRRDLHDGLGPTLTGVAYASDAARNLLRANPDEAERLIVSVRSDVRDAIGDVRRLVDGLRPSALDQLGLVGAVAQHSTHLHTAIGARLDVWLSASASLPALPAATEVAAYRIITEALTNVARHACADRAEVAISADEDALLIVISDTGAAVAEPGWKPGVGLSSMRERAELLGGTFSAAPGELGGAVRVSLPLR